MNKKDLKNLKQGDLIHLPSDVTLFKYAKSKKWGEIPFVKRTQITQRPYTTPFIGFNNNFTDRKSKRLNSSHSQQSRMPSSA